MAIGRTDPVSKAAQTPILSTKSVHQRTSSDARSRTQKTVEGNLVRVQVQASAPQSEHKHGPVLMALAVELGAVALFSFGWVRPWPSPARRDTAARPRLRGDHLAKRLDRRS